MRQQSFHRWESTLRAQLASQFVNLRASLWVIPALFTLIAVALGQTLIWLDSHLWKDTSFSEVPFVFAGGVEGARGVLSSISGSLITVTGTVFSLTIVALQLASGQMTPRILRKFTSDRQVQVVLGLLVGTFTYSILVLRVVRSEDSNDAAFVPAIATTVAIMLSLVSVGALIIFIHHVSRLIQISVVVARTADDNLDLLSQMERPPEGAVMVAPPARRMDLPVHPVTSTRSGYVQAIDQAALFDLCREYGVTVEILCSPGEFVLERAHLALVWSVSKPDDSVEGPIRRAIVLGDEPTGQADIGFAIRQITDIALRALSPGINDPTTAMVCLDRLGQLLAAAGRRPPAATAIQDEAGRGVLILGDRPSFSTLIETAFVQLRHYGAADPLVMAHAIDTLAAIIAVVPDEAAGPLRREAGRYAATARRTVADEDQSIIDAALERYEWSR